MDDHAKPPIDLITLTDRTLQELFTREGLPALLSMPDVGIQLSAHQAYLVLIYAQLGITHPQAQQQASAYYARSALGDIEEMFSKAEPVLGEVIRRGWLRARPELRKPAPLIACDQCGGAASSECAKCNGMGKIRDVRAVMPIEFTDRVNITGKIIRPGEPGSC